MDVFNNFRPSQNTLNLIFEVKPPIRKNAVNLRQVFKYLTPDSCQESGKLDYSPFLFLDHNAKLQVCTTYDGDFIDYLHKVINHHCDVLNALLSYVLVPQDLIPIEQNQAAFIDYITALNVKDQVFYSAHPEPKVAEIIKDKPEYDVV
ncbi:hypothetical protein [Thalassomonas sp. RHCl1]|uniref:hypothetical protein n=1 Tax=Thalassomonas sp. RHCl1 TaxID=2995320 RepID=UPI00248B8109|nr:hypothetical protein [Thalassomonas sp. RHCl1]